MPGGWGAARSEVLGNEGLTKVRTLVSISYGAVTKHTGWVLEQQKLMSHSSGGWLLPVCSCGREREMVLFPSCKTTRPTGSGLVTSFNLNFPLKGPVSKYRASAQEFGGTPFSP